jgi:hypothetical protein
VPAARDTPIKSCEYRLIINDRVIDACADPQTATPVSTYFNPPGNLCNITPKKDRELGNTRSFHREPGSAMCVEAPGVAEVLLLLYEPHRLKELLGETWVSLLVSPSKK